MKKSVFSAVGLMISILPVVAQAGPTIGIGPGFFIEDSVRDVVREIEDLPADNTGADEDFDGQEYVSDGLYNLNIWVLAPLFHKNLRLGGGLSWFNNYTLKPKDAEEPDDGPLCEETNECYRVGHLFQGHAQGEFIVPEVVSKLDIALGLKVGLLAALAKGELNSKLEDLDNEGFDVFPNWPRFGGVLGPYVAALWPLTPKLGVRGEFGVQWSRLGFYDGEAEEAQISVRTASGLSTTRLMLVLGLDIHP